MEPSVLMQLAVKMVWPMICLEGFFVPLVSVHESLLLLVIEHESMSDVDHDTVTVYPF